MNIDPIILEALAPFIPGGLNALFSTATEKIFLAKDATCRDAKEEAAPVDDLADCYEKTSRH